MNSRDPHRWGATQLPMPGTHAIDKCGNVYVAPVHPSPSSTSVEMCTWGPIKEKTSTGMAIGASRVAVRGSPHVLASHARRLIRTSPRWLIEARRHAAWPLYREGAIK